MGLFAVFLPTSAPPNLPDVGPAGAFLKVDGRECLLRSAELFANREEVAQVLTCFEPDADEEGRRRFGNHLMFTGVKLGDRAEGWYGQIASMGRKLQEEVTHLIIHDPARPAVAFDELDALVAAVDREPVRVCSLALPPLAGVVSVDERGKATGEIEGRIRPVVWPRIYPVSSLEPLVDGQEPRVEDLLLIDSRPANVRCDAPADAKFVAAMLKLLPERKKEGPLNPFDEAQW